MLASQNYREYIFCLILWETPPSPQKNLFVYCFLIIPLTLNQTQPMKRGSPWREGFYYILWGVRQNGRASLENSCQTTGLDIVALNYKSKLSRSHHDTDAESHHIWWLFPAPKSRNSACWSKQPAIPFYHKPQHKVKRTAALHLQNKVGI